VTVLSAAVTGVPGGDAPDAAADAAPEGRPDVAS